MTHEIEDTLSNDAGQPGNGAQRRAPRKKKGGKARVWKPDNSRFYHMEFWYRGRRYTGTTKRTDRGEAVAYAKGEREKAIAAHVNFGPYLGRDMSFGEAVNRYFEERGQHVADPKHLERQLNWLLDKAGDATPLSQIDNNLLAKLMATKKNEYRWGDPNCGKVSNQTVNHVVLDLVRLILRKARLDWNIMLPAEPHYRRHRLKVSQRTAEFSLSQEEALVSQRPEDYGPLVRFGIKTALRKRDLLLRWDQVDWDNECIKVRAKGDVDHEVPLTPSIKAMLDAQKGRHDEFVWTFVCRRRTTLRSGEVLIEGERYPVTYNSFSGAFARMRKDAGIKDRRIHDLRKTAGARMHRVTGDLGCVQELLGHANISLTRKHYTNITRKDRERRMIETEEAYENKRALMLADESSE